jgi:hypothetical protein
MLKCEITRVCSEEGVARCPLSLNACASTADRPSVMASTRKSKLERQEMRC